MTLGENDVDCVKDVDSVVVLEEESVFDIEQLDDGDDDNDVEVDERNDGEFDSDVDGETVKDADPELVPLSEEVDVHVELELLEAVWETLRRAEPVLVNVYEALTEEDHDNETETDEDAELDTNAEEVVEELKANETL